MQVGDTVEIKEFNGGRWEWSDLTGLITESDKYCYSVRRDDNGEHIRDVRHHFRTPKNG